MAIPYSADYRPLGGPAHRFRPLAGPGQPPARQSRPREPRTLLAGLEASLSAATLEELIRDLAGWSVPPAGPIGAGRAGAQWLW